MLELILIRHPKTIANHNGVLQGGGTDAELVPGWEKDVDELAEKLVKLGNFDAVLASDLKRADLPARRIFDRMREEGWHLDYVSTYILRERNWGILDGTDYEKLPYGKQCIAKQLFQQGGVDGGEALNQIEKRIERVNREYIDKYKREVGVMEQKFFDSLVRHLPESGVIRENVKKYVHRLAVIGSGVFFNYYINHEVREGVLTGGYKRFDNLESRALIMGNPAKELSYSI